MLDSANDLPGTSAPAVEYAIETARRLAEAGQYRQAIEALADLDPESIDFATLRDLVVWRAAAFEPGTGRSPWPPILDDPFPGFQGVPEIKGADLTADILGGAVQNHGCLLVRSIIDGEQTRELAQIVNRALETIKDSIANLTDPPPRSQWFAPYPLGPEDEMTEAGRAFVTRNSSLWTADSPRALSVFIAFLKAHNVTRAIEGYLGEPAYLSVGKSTLRRIPPTTGTSWHQDGAFLGADIRTVNCWLALSDCGEDAPGLEVYPRRLNKVVETGTRGAPFDWSVGDGVVDDLAKTAPVASPLFKAGDALLFDQLFLHRTGVRPGMTRDRLAIETWFFAGSVFPMKQIPLAL